MKRFYSLLIILFCDCLIFSCHTNTATNHSSAPSKLSPAMPDTGNLSLAMDTVMQAYMQLKSAIAIVDLSHADTLAGTLKLRSDHLPIGGLQKDETRYNNARTTIASLDGEVLGLQGETGIVGKREEFAIISDMLYDLMRATGIKSHIVYRYFCAAALNGNGAHWLDTARQSANPYGEEQGADCGVIDDTLQF